MEINSDFISYVQREIIPLYGHFDKAHGTAHADSVIKNSLSIAADYPVDMNMVYVIAAYHDVGLGQGREKHEKASAEYLLADDALRRWFSAGQLLLMAEAVEDHRASIEYEPRSIYGKIVSEADREIAYLSILTRTIQYSLKHFPGYSFEQHLERTFEHIRTKYGEGGYAKLWLNTETNRRNLSELRSKSLTKEALMPDFMRIFAECTK